MTILLWILAVVLICVGVAGVVLPALPGIVFVFGGILLAAWIDDFTRISVTTVVVLGVLAALAFVIDYVASAAAAKKAGASEQGLIGAALGTVLGIFTGFIGLIFMPLVGAAIGEYIAQRDALKAGRIGLATWIGLLVGTVLKLAIVFTMLGVFVAALLI
ncbi:MAG: DUF456 domain-containing protein [Betaproteobacteria bacterium]